jgi:hypothetical protein
MENKKRCLLCNQELVGEFEVVQKTPGRTIVIQNHRAHILQRPDLIAKRPSAPDAPATDTPTSELPPAWIPAGRQTHDVWDYFGFYLCDSVHRCRWDVPPNERLPELRFVHRTDGNLFRFSPYRRDEVPVTFRSRLDVARKTERARQVVENTVRKYEDDWRTQVEREDLIRTKRLRKAQQNPELTSIHSARRIPYHHGLDEPSPELKQEWETKLQHAMNEDHEKTKGHLPRYYKDWEIEPYPAGEQRQGWHQRSEDDERDDYTVFENMRIINLGVRDTYVSRKTVIPREKWLEGARQKLNPYGEPQSVWEPPPGVTEQTIKTLAVQYVTQFESRPIAETLRQVGSNITTGAQKKRAARVNKKHKEIDWSKAVGNYYCVVHLNGQDYLKILAPLSADLRAAADAWFRNMTRSMKDAAKRKQSPEAKAAARERIRAAYYDPRAEITRADPAFWKPPVRPTGTPVGRVVTLSLTKQEGIDDEQTRRPASDRNQSEPEAGESATSSGDC